MNDTQETLIDQRWIRLPKRGPEPNSGLSRAGIYQLIGAGLVKSAAVKKPGNIRGIRVVWLPSLMAYIESCVEQPRQQEEGGAA